jgi:hypothetical protein
MQLMEKGLPKLNYVDQVAKLCPQLRDVRVLQDDGERVEKKRGITLRMLLSYTFTLDTPSSTKSCETSASR